MDMMMNILHAHNNASKLEREMNKECANMNGNGDWLYETEKFMAMLEAKSEESKAESKTEIECVDEYADITENTNDLSSSADDSEVNSLFNESIQISATPTPQPKPVPVPQISNKPLQFLTVSQATSGTANLVLPKVQSKPKPKKKKTITQRVRYNIGYKYGGKGFDVYTGFKNKSKPIYASTTLYCYETKNRNKKLLREYLVEEGKFGGKTAIESISFGFGWYGEDVAYIRVRGSMKTIKNKIRQLNNKNGAVLSIYVRKQHFNAASEENKTLFVNNFDITDKTVHRRFTNLFLKHGQLVKDIKMGIDRNNDPYAIVSFMHLADAKACYRSACNEIYFDEITGQRQESSIRFGGKNLSVSYSKRM